MNFGKQKYSMKKVITILVRIEMLHTIKNVRRGVGLHVSAGGRKPCIHSFLFQHDNDPKHTNYDVRM